jgi:tRNA(fMet)-specific endonuclease VapC
VILLDTDHLSILSITEGSGHARLRGKLNAIDSGELGTTIISVEELTRGWLAHIKRFREPHRQVVPYARLGKLMEFLTGWSIKEFDDLAADLFVELRQRRIRIGSMDLKIASIAMVHDALLLSANLRDFRQVPGLQVESWLD